MDCPKVQSNLTEAFLPYILASLKCTLLDKVKTNFPFVCSLTVHIAIRKKGGFRSRDAGRSGGLFRQKKGEHELAMNRCVFRTEWRTELGKVILAIGHESLEGGFVILGYVDKANDAIVEQTALDDL